MSIRCPGVRPCRSARRCSSDSRCLRCNRSRLRWARWSCSRRSRSSSRTLAARVSRARCAASPACASGSASSRSMSRWRIRHSSPLYTFRATVSEGLYGLHHGSRLVACRPGRVDHLAYLMTASNVGADGIRFMSRAPPGTPAPLHREPRPPENPPNENPTTREPPAKPCPLVSAPDHRAEPRFGSVRGLAGIDHRDLEMVGIGSTQRTGLAWSQAWGWWTPEIPPNGWGRPPYAASSLTPDAAPTASLWRSGLHDLVLAAPSSAGPQARPPAHPRAPSESAAGSRVTRRRSPDPSVSPGCVREPWSSLITSPLDPYRPQSATAAHSRRTPAGSDQAPHDDPDDRTVRSTSAPPSECRSCSAITHGSNPSTFSM
jgi:hypothetical protein